MSDFQWVTTAPNPRSTMLGSPDAGQRGWRLHAVRASENTKFSDIRGRRAACGLLPRHGWSLDLFIEEKCQRCLALMERAAAARESLEGETQPPSPAVPP